MKAHVEHRVPLSDAALSALHQARVLSSGSGLIFPGPSGAALSNVTALKLLRTSGIACVTHGFRSSFSRLGAARPASPARWRSSVSRIASPARWRAPMPDPISTIGESRSCRPGASMSPPVLGGTETALPSASSGALIHPVSSRIREGTLRSRFQAMCAVLKRAQARLRDARVAPRSFGRCFPPPFPRASGYAFHSDFSARPATRLPRSRRCSPRCCRRRTSRAAHTAR